jgi:hypothetical protein
VDVLDRLAKMLEVPIFEFFRAPRKGAAGEAAFRSAAVAAVAAS